MSIYIHKNGQQSGPFEENAVIEQLRSGQLSPDDKGIREGDKDWQPLGTMFPQTTAVAPLVSNADTATPKGGGCRKIFGIFTLLFGLFFLVAAIGMAVFFNTNDYGPDLCAQAATDAAALEQAKKDYESAKGTPNETAAKAKESAADRTAWSSNSLCEVQTGRVRRGWFFVIVSAVLGFIFVAAGFVITRMKASA